MAEPLNLKPLTSLRFFAAFWVVLFHYWPHLAADSTPAVVAKGYLGVELFFILSGFILCHVYLPAVEAGRFRYGDFLWARLARIYPMHLATLIGIGLIGGLALMAGLRIDPNILSLSALPANLAMVHAWGLAPVVGWNHPSWSISAEWFAYLGFPAFAALALSLRRRPRLAVVLALLFMAALYPAFESVAGFPLTRATTGWGALRIVPCFAYGCALYLAWRAHAVDGRKAVLGAAFFGACAVFTAQLQAPDVLIVALFGGLIISLAQASRAGARLGEHPILVYLGEISYSIYMVCIPWELVFVNVAAKIFHIADKRLPWPLWIVFLLTVVPLAALTHGLIERPARDWMKSWRSLRAPRTIAAVTVR